MTQENILGLTEKGLAEKKQRAILMPLHARMLLAGVDGKRTVAQACIGMPADHQGEAHNILVSSGLAWILVHGRTDKAQEVKLPSQSVRADAPPNPTPPRMTEKQIYSIAYPMAVKLTSALGMRGFILNMSVESAGGLQGLIELLPKIKKAVGDVKCAPLEKILAGR